MSISMFGYDFDGPMMDLGLLKNEPGVFLIICQEKTIMTILDVGEAEHVQDRIQNHERRNNWIKSCRNQLNFAVLYTNGRSELERKELEHRLRTKVKPRFEEKKYLVTPRSNK